MIYAKEIESLVLGAILLDNKAFDEARQFLQPDIFSDENKIFYNSFDSLYREGKPIDNITVYQDLKQRGFTDKEYLISLSKMTQNISSASNIIYHSKILAEKWMLRRLLRTKKLLENINETTDPFDKLSELNNDIYEIENLISVEKDKTLWGEFQNLMDTVEKKYKGEIDEGLKCDSFPSLNKATGGIMPVDFVVIYGLEKSAKTTFTERLIMDFVLKGFPVGAFTMEMDFETYCYKALSMNGNLEYLKLRNPRGNNLTEDEFHKFYKKSFDFKDTKFFIDSKTRDFDKMISKAKLWKRKYGIKLFVFDYLGLVHSRRRFERRDLEIAYFTQTLKSLAKELETPVIGVSQANKEDKTADSVAALRDCDFAIRTSKPTEIGIKSITTKYNEQFVFSEDHFLVTIERSRFGRNKQNFVCQFYNNNFVEIDLENRLPIIREDNEPSIF